MFKKDANKPNEVFNNKLFSCETIPRMRKPIAEIHPTMARLYEAAKLLHDVEGPSELAALLNESPQVINNWERRGISSAGILTVGPLVGCRSDWLKDGSGDMVAAAGKRLTANSVDPEDLVSPDTSKLKAGVKNAFSPELTGLFDEIEAAARGGWLTGEIIKTLGQVLRLAAPASKKPTTLHTEHHILAEGTEGQGNEHGRSARRQGRQAKAG
jgi:hypothetical protein